MAIACITTMQDQTCQASCKPPFSLATWPVFAMVSSSCLAVLGSVPPCFLSATFTVQSSANSKPYHLQYVQWVKQRLAGKSAPGLMEFYVTTFENSGTSHVGLLRSFIGIVCVGL
ncbi:hypothetical protein NC653_038700 [Populus alba x Populus x berolinensis]|uniref:Uncharacterized protein n=1 Tax=Populus alba x Populus x berolinensis TaxID=444605 RepID=A0AAD6LHN2_9ROSI|nr:hypothetical protein NC653_038700 [Populus alba x Populus x berolinensis]